MNLNLIKVGFMSEEDVRKIKEILDSNNVEYKLTEHEPVYTSEQAAKVRGAEIKTGVKALVLKSGDGKMILGLVAADRKIDLKKLSDFSNTRDLKLARPEEVLERTGCEIGSVHPFGLIHNLATYMDESVLENEYVEFNVGLHTKSIRMKSKDLVKIIKPIIGGFSK